MAGAPHWPYPRLIAHRGGGCLAPENTLVALQAGHDAGYRGVEFDVMLSGSGTPVLIHDETLVRTTGVAGAVAATADDVLFSLDAGAWRAPAFRGERIPGLREAAHRCQALALWPNIEIKPSAGADAQTGRVVGETAAALWCGAGPSDLPPLLSSFSVAALQAARAAAPRLPRGLLCERPPADAVAQALALECVSIHVDWHWIDAAFVAQAHRAGLAVVAYTVNESLPMARCWRYGVSAVITDRIDVFDPADGEPRPAAPGA